MPAALQTISRLSGHVAQRPRGIIVALTNGGRLIKWGANGWHSWQPGLLDLLAEDWIVLSPETQRRMNEQAAAERAAQEAAAASSEPKP